jgi:hypothetical protein
MRPESAISSINAAQSELAAKAPGFAASFSSRTIAGLPSTCAAVTGNGQAAEFCVTGSGQLASVTASPPAESFELEKHVDEANPADFVLAAGASVVDSPPGS